MSEQVLEGTWEEVAEHANELAGRRVRLTIIEESNQPQQNQAMIEALRKVRERATTMSVSSGDETLRIIREGRAGKMWGYDGPPRSSLQSAALTIPDGPL